MKRNNAQNSSAKKKLIPAVAMFTASAVMLSTATYAWFTMNKTAKLTGLAMTATTSDTLEISLGSVKGENKAITDVKVRPADTKDELSWTNLIDVSEYYSDVDLLEPASSVNGVNLFYATDPTNAGMTATNFETANTAAGITARANKVTGTAMTNNKDKKGYYVDLPVHLRTSKFSDTPEDNTIYCKMKITDPDDKDASTPEGELYKAVRVAFIPTDENGTSSANAASSIWGETSEYYTENQAVSAGTPDNTRSAVTVIDGANLNSGEKDIGITIPSTTKSGAYGHTDFIVRVWLEGESVYCQDANASQNWNIDFAFSLTKDDKSFTVDTTTKQG